MAEKKKPSIYQEVVDFVTKGKAPFVSGPPKKKKKKKKPRVQKTNGDGSLIGMIKTRSKKQKTEVN